MIGSTFGRDAYERAVARAVEYIAAGDIFQVNLSQRYTVEQAADAELIFHRLTDGGGAHYGAMLEFDEFAVISNTPELFLSVTPRADGRRKVVTRPIKGTRPRGAGMEQALRDSIKDQAELNMIVDLERNDLGRVCEIGTVKVIEARLIEAHPTVYHGVATVEGVLRDDVGFVELLAATFPGGSITGAPKIRAMQIIEELEPVRRGVYCGAIGYIGGDGSMQFNIAIRTMTMKGGIVHVPVGGGVVADSRPAAEYEETLVKARAMFAALGV
jgi:para-aminobenzoate synthetase component 1